MRIYLDSSALVKLVAREPESEALRGFLRRHREDGRVTSALARVEVVRAVLEGGPPAVAHARRQLSRVDQVHVDDELLDSAALLRSAGLLRSLDAIHIATAQLLGPDLLSLVSYDHRMQDAAAGLGLPVDAPS
ncbi:MAG TPA: type II toxin-antitoxin system VapC family toxin [Intrasporangium sp.]|uniref:type II toxin-antitoxin system VapC family toxin n=1 Tax=Intrasporangium sp. TaxID=1925024 RepID=UPI002D78BA56|nr:type II toxin-antitoxin system VapC family toxin [Intrasporangium sp.]HET7399069.1 type II toxin-antitoxin system VapC family toxin [Intrasporangium sp.]